MPVYAMRLLIRDCCSVMCWTKVSQSLELKMEVYDTSSVTIAKIQVEQRQSDVVGTFRVNWILCGRRFSDGVSITQLCCHGRIVDVSSKMPVFPRNHVTKTSRFRLSEPLAGKIVLTGSASSQQSRDQLSDLVTWAKVQVGLPESMEICVRVNLGSNFQVTRVPTNCHIF
jgi:hypothetical protein